MHTINNDFLIGIAGQFKINTVDRTMTRRHNNAQPARHPPDRPALKQKGCDDDNKGGIKQKLAFGNAFDHRYNRQKDRHRTTQTDPRNKCGIIAREVKEHQAQPHRDRAGDKHQNQCQDDTGNDHSAKFRRGGQQAQGDKHRDLGQPCGDMLKPSDTDAHFHVAVAGI